MYMYAYFAKKNSLSMYICSSYLYKQKKRKNILQFETIDFFDFMIVNE